MCNSTGGQSRVGLPALRRLDAVNPAFELLLRLVDEVFPVQLEDAKRAREILLAGAALVTARDALHAAVMERKRITQIMTFDKGFDHIAQVQRLDT